MVGPRPAVGGRGHRGKYLGGAGANDREDGTGLDRGEIGLAILVLTHGHEGREPCDGLAGACQGGKVARSGQSPGPSVLCDLECAGGYPGRFGQDQVHAICTDSNQTDRWHRPRMVVGYLGQMAHGEVQPVDGRGLDEGGQG